MNKLKVLCIHIEGIPFLYIALDDADPFVPGHYGVPLGFLDLVALLVGVILIGRQGKAGYFQFFTDGVDFGFIADISDEGGLVTCHLP